jgi:hypothetical protein
MSREVTGTGPEVTKPSRPGLPAPLARSRRVRAVAGGLASLAVVTGAAVWLSTGGPDEQTPRPFPTTTADGAGPPTTAGTRTGSLPVGEGLVATLAAAGTGGADLTRVEVTVILDNGLPTARELVSVEVLGLGPAVVEPVDGVVLPAGRQTRLRATISVDCRVRLETERPDVSVRVVQRRAGRLVTELAGLDPVASLDVLGPLCPPVTRGLAVRITSSRSAGGGPVTVRIVNHGRRSALVTPRAAPDAGPARLVSDPPLPYDLGPGEALVAVLDVTLVAVGATTGSTTGRAAPGCPGSAPDVVADALFLEAETRDGYTAVTGFPTTALAAAVARAVERAGCPPRG